MPNYKSDKFRKLLFALDKDKSKTGQIGGPINTTQELKEQKLNANIPAIPSLPKMNKFKKIRNYFKKS